MDDPDDFEVEGAPHDSIDKMRWVIATGTNKADECEGNAQRHLEMLSKEQLIDMLKDARAGRFRRLDSIFLGDCVSIQDYLEFIRRFKADLSEVERRD